MEHYEPTADLSHSRTKVRPPSADGSKEERAPLAPGATALPNVGWNLKLTDIGYSKWAAGQAVVIGPAGFLK
ncbi:MAG TPA: hypothetical protein VGJ84_16490 [Polyangiaceae bacterium]